jgi:hypothetical protein
VDPEVSGLINGSLLASYYAEMKTKGQPLLHVAAVSRIQDQSQFRATDMDLKVNQLWDDATGKLKTNLTQADKELSTLKYLCMSGVHLMPPLRPVPNWNWVTASESQQWAGVIANYIQPELMEQVLKNRYLCQVNVVKDSSSIPRYYFGLRSLGGGPIINPDNSK